MLTNAMMKTGAGRAIGDAKYVMPAVQGGGPRAVRNAPARETADALDKARARKPQRDARSDRTRQEHKLQAENDGAVLLCRD